MPPLSDEDKALIRRTILEVEPALCNGSEDPIKRITIYLGDGSVIRVSVCQFLKVGSI